MEKILVVRFSSLGDLVLVSGIFRELKKKYPGSRITLLTLLEYAALFSNNPHIDHIVTLDRKENPNKKTFFNTVKTLRNEKFSIVYDFHKSIRSGLFVFFLKLGRSSSIKCYGYDKRSVDRYYYVWYKRKPKTVTRQAMAYHQLLDRVRPGFPIDFSTELFPSDDAREKVRALISDRTDGRIVVGIAPGASHDTKKWPADYFATLIAKLHARNVFIILIGGKTDKECGDIEHRIDDKRLLLNLAGKLDYLESAYALSLCASVVSNDSAVGHMAEAVKTPVAVIFGSTAMEFGYGPYLPDSQFVDVDLPCRPCSTTGKKKCVNPTHKECLKNIAPETVDRVVMAILSKQCGIPKPDNT